MGMKISGMSSIRVETDWPCHIDIDREHENLIAYTHLMSDTTLRHEWEGQQVQVLLKESMLGVFISPYPDADPPEWWRDAEVLWRYDQVEPQETP
jgi:hypothetical protein